MGYQFDGTIYKTAQECAYAITETFDDDIYDEMLDDCSGPVNICSMEYAASVALYRIDPTAYNCGRYDYYDSLAGDIAYELERLDDGETWEGYGAEVCAVFSEEGDA